MKMFKTFGTFSVLALANLASAATPSHNLRVNVPFSFVVAGREFQPGSYEVSQSDTGMITVQGGGESAVVLSTPGVAKASDATALRFTSSNSREYLTGFVVTGETVRSVPLPSAAGQSLTVTAR